jgi:hypothetical protein
MWRSWLSGAVAAVLAFNGLHMLAAPEHWYGSIESVAHTGPFNGHFVRDIGCAYLAAALGLVCATIRPTWRVPGALTALAFIGAHAGVHAWELATGHHSAAHTGLVDAIGIYGPPLAALAVLVPGIRRNAQPAIGGLT